MSAALLVAVGATATLAVVLNTIGGASSFLAANLGEAVVAQQKVPDGACQNVEEDVEFHTPDHQTIEVLAGFNEPDSCCIACKAHPKCNVWTYAAPEGSIWNGMANVAGHCFFKRINLGAKLIRIPRRGFFGGWFPRESQLQKMHRQQQEQQKQKQKQKQKDQVPLTRYEGLLAFAATAVVSNIPDLDKGEDDTFHPAVEEEVKSLRGTGPDARVKLQILPVQEGQLPKSRRKESGPGPLAEISEHNSVWEVVAPSVPVMLKPGGPRALPIGYKKIGQILVGRRVGSMVKLTHDFGLVPIKRPDGGKPFLHERTFSYRTVHRGTCADAGYSPIQDPKICAAAAFALGYFDRHVTQYTGNLHRPEGCYLHSGLIWMAMSPANKGRGAVANFFPICSRLTSSQAIMASGLEPHSSEKFKK